jgi:hypothetical protein
VAKILTDLRDQPFTVCFIKKEGEERILRGRLLPSPETVLGRLMAEDLDIAPPSAKRIRLIDVRTLRFVIVEGIKYTVKS